MQVHSRAELEAEHPAAAFNEAALQQLGLGAPVAANAISKVVIGFVDYGFDLLHPCLLDAAGKASRFACLWDQNRTPDSARAADLDVAMIADWDAEFLNAKIAQAQTTGSRRALDAFYDPHANNCGRYGTQGGAHGTMMASIAAGTPFAGFRSAAPNALLVGAQLALCDRDWKEEDAHGVPTWVNWDAQRQPKWNGWRAYDEALQIVNAVRYIYDRSCRLGADGLVINLSIGAWAGAHDGRSPVELGIAELLAQADEAAAVCRGPLTAVVIGAGNAGADEGHFAGVVSDGAPATFDWLMHRADPTQNKLEIWYDNSPADRQPLAVSLIAPGHCGHRLAIIPGETHAIVIDGVRVGIADHVPNARGALARVRILLHPPLFPERMSSDPGANCTWSLSVSTPVSQQPPAAAVRLHAWVERDDGVMEQSTLFPSHPENTLCCLATVDGAIVVAGYDHHVQTTSALGELGVMAASSLGPAAWTRSPLPHVCAPGHRIWGARSKSRGFQETTGTSASVALVSGVLAATVQKNDHKEYRSVLQSIIFDFKMFKQIKAHSNNNIHMNDWSVRTGFGAIQKQ